MQSVDNEFGSRNDVQTNAEGDFPPELQSTRSRRRDLPGPRKRG
jgi:hypothetical protein